MSSYGVAMKYTIQRGFTIITLITAVTLAGCSSQPETPDPAGQAQIENDAANADVHHVDGTMVVPGTDFGRYKKIIVTALDVDNAEVVIPDLKTPWRLSDHDKGFFKEQYTQAAVINLIADGAYETSLDPGADVLLLRSRIIRIAAPTPNDIGGGRSADVQTYYRDSGIVTITMELYDSSTQKLLGMITDSRDVGRIWDENNFASSSLQINQAFDHWLKSLRTELDTLSRRQSPLDKLLIH